MTYLLSLAMLVMVMLVFVLAVVLYVQNERVYRIRKRLIRQVDTCSRVDIARGEDFKWRWQDFDSVSYHKMVFNFWRDPMSFYSDKRFIDPYAVGEKDD